MKVGTRETGLRNGVFIVAELSGNHNGSLKRALKIIDAAANAGADAVKLQTYTPDTITIDSDSPLFRVKSGKNWKGKTLYQLYKEAHTPWRWHKKLFAHARRRGLTCFSTPFDESAVAFLEKLGNPIYKVASFEIVDVPLLREIGKTHKPVIISRGMASPKEIKQAIAALKKAGTKEIVVLQCVSAYPPKPEDMNLATIPDIRKRFKVSTGLSDHTLSNDVAIAAVALGAVVIEKHLTLRRKDGGPDSAFSLEPAEFKALVRSIRTTESAIGKPTYAPRGVEKKNVQFRRSLFVVADVKKGERFSARNVRSIRPGNGLPPKYYNIILDRRASKDIPKATPLRWNLVKGARPRRRS